MIELLNDNAGAVTGLATVALVVFTIRYVQLTAKLVRLQQAPRLSAVVSLWDRPYARDGVRHSVLVDGVLLANKSCFPLRVVSIRCKAYGGTCSPFPKRIRAGTIESNGLLPEQSSFITMRGNVEPSWDQEYYLRLTVSYHLMNGERGTEQFPITPMKPPSTEGDGPAAS
jgi:hypothetical protein